MKRALALSDYQMSIVRHAAAALPVAARDGFLQEGAARLADTPSDNAVQAAINASLDRTPVFLNDSASTKKGATP